jgi:PAS domain S-box-containing protein
LAPARDHTGRVVGWCGIISDIEDRKRNEVALRESEVNLRKIINTLPTTAWSTRPDGYCDFLSHRWLDYAGFSAEQAEGWGWAAVIHPDDLTALSEYWQSCLDSGTPVDTEARMRRSDGEYRWFLFRANPLRNENGKIIRWYGTNIDIEDRKQAEHALAASERDLKLSIDTIPGLTWFCRADGWAEFLNKQWRDYTGLSGETGLGWNWADVIHPDDLPELQRRWQEALSTNKPDEHEARIRRLDGQYRWFLFRTNPLLDGNGRVLKWYGTNIDIEDRKRATEALKASELNLRELTETIPEMLWSATAEGAIDYCNTRFQNYTGFDLLDLMGDGWQKTIHPEDAERVAQVWMTSVTTGAPYQVEVRTFHHIDSTYRWCAVSALPLCDQEQRIVKWHGTIVDIHDRKLAELVRSERDAKRTIDTIRGLTWFSRADGWTEYVNKQWRDYTGLSNEEALGWKQAAPCVPR